MPCVPFQIGQSRGYVCVAARVTKLMRGVWMEWHSYLGPTFWRDRDCTKPIMDWVNRPRLIAEFDRWYAEQKVKEVL